MGLIIMMWIFILVVGGFGIAWLFMVYEVWAKLLLAGAVVLLILGGLGGTVFMSKTASYKRSMKDWDSELNENIEREIVVHSRSGDVIYEAKGKFDVAYSNGRLKWIDEDGHVQIIYLGDSSTAVVNEIE